VAGRSKDRDLILGVDFGGTKIRCAVADSHGRIIARNYGATPAREGPEVVLQAVVDLARGVVKEVGATFNQLKGIGVAAAGPLNSNTGVVFLSPNLYGWHNVPLRDLVERKLGIKTLVENDANAAALGELYFGAGRGVRNLIYITVSTGIGGGIIIDGKLYRGACGTAGEVGHMTIDLDGPRCNCGNTGCWETLASGTALARRAKQRIEQGAETSVLSLVGGDIDGITAKTIAAAAEQGDPFARELITENGYYLGVGFVNLVNLFNPELILVGGGLSNMGEALLKPAIEVVKERAFREVYESVRFELAGNGDDAGLLGAIALVREGIDGQAL